MHAPVLRNLAHVPDGAVDALQERLQGSLENLVILRTTEPALGLELHILYTTGRAGQSTQFIRRLADVLADHRLQDRRQVQLLVLALDKLLFLSTILTQVQFFFL